MDAKEAHDSLNPYAWAMTSVFDRLSLIESVQANLKKYAFELGQADAQMKNNLIGEEIVSRGEGVGATVNAMANTLMACRNLYESLAHGEMPKPLSIRSIGDGKYEVEVYPIQKKDRLISGKQRGFLHVKGKPQQVNPLEKPAGIIAVSGAGNYSSSIEMTMALFLENKAVIHKPHQLNEGTDKIWEKIFEPLVSYKALVFIDPEQSRQMDHIGRFALYLFYGFNRCCPFHSGCCQCSIGFRMWGQ